MHHDSCISSICNRGHNAIEEHFEITAFLVGKAKEIHPSIHFDLEKYHPEVWMYLRQVKQEHISQCLTSNLQRGMKAGIYRPDIDVGIVVRIYLSRFDIVFDKELFPSAEFKIEDVLWEMFTYHLRGIVSEKGALLLDKKLKEFKNK